MLGVTTSLCFLCWALSTYVTSYVTSYESVPFDSASSCNFTYLQQHANSAPHLKRLIQAYDQQFFLQSCDRAPPHAHHSRGSLWDDIRPRPKVVIFMHSGLFSRTAVVMEEIFTALELSGLLKEAVGMYMGVSGNGVVPSLPSKVHIRAADIALSAELSTYTALVRYLETVSAAEEAQTVVVYLHTKGSFHRERGSDDWRRFMLFFNVWMYRWTLIMLQHYQTFGVNLHMPTARYFGAGHAHYIGNYWNARVSYLKALDREFVSRHSFLQKHHVVSELWLGTGLQSPEIKAPLRQRMGCLIASGVNHFLTEFPTAKYTSWGLYRRLATHVYAHHPPRANVTALAPELAQCVVMLPSPYGERRPRRGSSRGRGIR